MSEPFLGEIRAFGFNFPPPGWAHCDGQILPINQNQALFSLLGTFYGGDGETNFALPDLRGRVPISFGDRPLGQKFGEETHTVTTGEMPNHDHDAAATTVDATTPIPAGAMLADSPGQIYAAPRAGALTAIHPASVAAAGLGQSHNNMQPYSVIHFGIALQGIFPSR